MSDAAPDPAAARHRADTARLNALTRFVTNFGPAIGDTRRHGSFADDSAPPYVVSTRNTAVADAFAAIGRLARGTNPAD